MIFTYNNGFKLIIFGTLIVLLLRYLENKRLRSCAISHLLDEPYDKILFERLRDNMPEGRLKTILVGSEPIMSNRKLRNFLIKIYRSIKDAKANPNRFKSIKKNILKDLI